MKYLLYIFLFSSTTLSAQSEKTETDNTFYAGIAFGRSFALGSFRDTKLNDKNAGFATSGNRFEIYAGQAINEKITLTGMLRYKDFSTDLGSLRSELEADNSGVTFSSTSDKWQTYFALVGLTYQVKFGEKRGIIPRFGIGPIVVKSPEFSVVPDNELATDQIHRSSETGVGFGYEIGFGFRRDLGKHITLLPTFSISGGWVKINDVTTTQNGVTTFSDSTPKILSINVGGSIAYRF